MLEIKDAEQSIARHIFKDAGLSYCEESSHCMLAKNGDEALGYVLFNMENGAISLLKLSPEEPPMLADSLLRSALFYAANHGIMDARFENTVSGNLIQKLGFCDNPSSGRIDITELFHSCGGCGK